MEVIQQQSHGGDFRRVKRLCNSSIATFNHPSLLPKLHGKSTLVTTKLCEQVYKSVTPHTFDLSTPKKHISSTLIEYNSLQDPHLKSYFYHPPRKVKLKETGFITEDLEVICSLKKYNAYKQFLEEEFLKIYHQKLQESQEDEQAENQCKQQQTMQNENRCSDNFEREQKRKQFFEQQEKRLRAKRRRLRRLQLEEEKAKERVVKEKKLQKEQAQKRREAELEERRIIKLKQEHEEAFKRKSMIDKAHIEEYLRLLHLHKMKQFERYKHMHELEERWEKYEKHAQLMHEEEDRKRKEELRLKEMKMEKRDKFYKKIQRKEEERKLKVHKENYHQAEMVVEEAEKFEKHWKNVHNEQIMECRENMKKQQEQWSLQQRRISLRRTSTMPNKTPNYVMHRSVMNVSPIFERKTESEDGSNKKKAGRPDTPNKAIEREYSSVAALEPINEIVSDSSDGRSSSEEEPIVVKSISDEAEYISMMSSESSCDLPSFSSKTKIVETTAEDRRSNDSSSMSSEISRVLSCDVQSSSSKTKSVRFDIPTN